jgi:membrane protease YdiL (CAAX protease family)
MSEVKAFVPDRLRSPVAQHRHDLKRQIMIIVLVLLGALAIQMTVESIIMTVALFSSGFIDKIISDTLASGGMPDTQALIASMTDGASPTANVLAITSLAATICGLPIFLVLRGKKLFTRDITERRDPMNASLLIRLFIIAMGAQLIFSLLSAGLNSLLAPLGFDSTKLYADSVKALSTPVGFVYILLIGPVCEEIMFRGAVMKSLERFGGNFAIVMSALFFGLFHVFTVQAIFAFLVGLILGYIAHRYSVLWSIVVHILLNTIATLLENSLSPSVLGFVFLALFVAAVILFILMRGQIKEQREAGKPFVIVPPHEVYPSYVIGDAGTGNPEWRSGEEAKETERYTGSPEWRTAEEAERYRNESGRTVPESGQERSVPTWERAEAEVVDPKLFRIAFSTISLDVYIVCVLIAGVVLMSGVISL